MIPWMISAPSSLARPASAVVVFKVGVDARGAAKLTARLTPLYGGGVRVVPVPGNHWSVLTEPHVHRLAEELLTTLPGEAPVRNEVVDVH